MGFLELITKKCLKPRSDKQNSLAICHARDLRQLNNTIIDGFEMLSASY